MPATKRGPGATPGPSVKDPEVYEAVRKEGASKQKAARIANATAQTSRRDVGRRGGKSLAYEDWTVADLREQARKVGVPRRSSMNKRQLIDALRHS
jgi:Rho termination factor, N-terminal domain